MGVLKRHKVLFIILPGVLAAAGFLWLRSYVFYHLGAAIEGKIRSLELSGFKVKFDELSTDWKRNRIEIRGLLLERNPYDTTCVYPEFIRVDHLRADGIRLFPLIFDGVLDLKTVYLDGPRVHLLRNSRMPQTKGRHESEFMLRADNIFVRSADFQYTDSVSCDVIAEITTGLRIEKLQLDFAADAPLAYAADLITVDSTGILLPADFYALSLRGAKVNMRSRDIEIDTLRIMPQLGKIDFGKKRGHEVDRFEGTVPRVTIHGFNFSLEDSGSFDASCVELAFSLNIFRDKRLPFRKVRKPLPAEILRDLPFSLRVDSVKIRDSYVQYEEFPEEAAEAGGLFFDNLYAVLTNIDNTADTATMNLAAQGQLMGSGTVHLSVAFPMTTKKRAYLRGSITDFPISRINPMLTPSTSLKVESGDLNSLNFTFTFSDARSNGEIQMNYQDLRLISFKEEDDGTKKRDGDGKPQKDNFKTFIMNTFIFRKDMDKDVPEEKRTGAIAFERDPYRSIFNFWVKSLLSGIKSAYNLDKTSLRKTERQIRREERLARRQERRIKRAEKHKSRG